MGELRRLVLMRHAQAAPTGPTDHTRALTATGRRQAAGSGAWLRARGFVPDAAVVSDARRAQETWTAAAEAAGWTTTRVQVGPGMYAADVDSALDLIRFADPDAVSILALGHNPTVASLAALLDDGTGEPDERMDFPPGTCLVLEFDRPWCQLSLGGARVCGVHRPPAGG